MSDDFAICQNCGVFDGRSTSIEDLKSQVLKSIFDLCVSKQNEPFEDVEGSIEEFLNELAIIIDYENQGYEGICTECGEYTKYSWQHIDYAERKAETKEAEQWQN